MDDEHALLNTCGVSFPELLGANVIESREQATNSARFQLDQEIL